MAQLVCTLAIACAAQFLARGSSRSLACSGSKAPTPGSAAEFHVTTVVSIYVWPVLLVEVSDGTTSVHVGYCMCGAISSSRKFQVVGVQWLEGTHPGSAAEFHVTTVVSIYVWPVLLVEVSDGTTSVHVGYCMCGAICSSRKFQVVGVQWLEGTHPWLGRRISCHHGCIDLCLACATRGSE